MLEPDTPVRFTRSVRLTAPAEVDLVAFPGDCGSFVGPAVPTPLDFEPVWTIAVRVNEVDYTAVCVADDFEARAPYEPTVLR